MSITRERLVAAAAIVFSVLVLMTSLEIGQTAIETALSTVTIYGTAVVLAALGLSLGLRKILKASKPVLVVAVAIALALWGMGKAVAEVIS